MSHQWKTPRKILCATDLSPSCDRAVDRALQLAGAWKAVLLLVHIVDDTGGQASVSAALERRAEAELRRQLASHPAAADVDLEVIVSQGDAAERILAKCDRMFADLLVLGAGEKASFRQRLLGSTVDRILRHALQPVLSVRDRAHVAYRTMAVATDFSPPSKEALDCALAFFPSAKATVVHAYEDTLHGLLASDQITGELAERHKIEMRASVESAMHEFVAEPQGIRPDLATTIEVGAPEAVMGRYVERHNPDLVVVGTHGRTGVRRAMIGSIAERLIGTTPRDVLAVRLGE
jgi:nucleotide-binding universal stress UspA family protein